MADAGEPEEEMQLNRLKKDKGPSVSGKYAADTTPEGLVKEVRKPAKSAPAQAKRKAIDLNELAEIKAQIVDAKEHEEWEEVKRLLKHLLSFEPGMEDLKVTKLGILMSDLRKIPSLSVFADIVLRMWKSLAAKSGIRPRNYVSPASPVPEGSPLTPSASFDKTPVSPTTAPTSTSTSASIDAGLAPPPAAVPAQDPAAEPAAAIEESPAVAAEEAAEPAGGEQNPSDEATAPAVAAEATSSNPELWGSYTDSSFEIFQGKELQPRNVMIKRLYTALTLPDADGNVEYTRDGSKDPREVAIGIEEALQTTFGGSAERIRNKYHQIYNNMMDKTNGSLRWSLLSGEVTPQKLVQMRPEEYAPEHLRLQRQKSKDFATEAAKAEWGEKRISDTFKCGKCGQRKTTYFQMQTRSADEPMTTFVTCVACGHAWKF
uniref:Transcription elongation factor n=1 Tax=Eutreptiella gymnastica TaxID=73025 RepID=A0A7S4LG67_9EUGL